MKYRICLYGGRGASSSYGGDKTTGDDGRPVKFYDKTDKYKGMSVHEFENAVRDKTVEYIGLFDDKGNLVVAGTSFNPHKVAIPSSHPNFKEAQTLTHNHPYKPVDDPNRTIGASFSDADVRNHVLFGFKGETRAVSNGPNENTYIFRAKPGAKTNNAAMLKFTNEFRGRFEKKANANLNKVNKRLAKQGKKLTEGQRSQVALGAAKKVWKSNAVDKAGYEYVEVKKAHW
jgi:hypothetical protein